jgi:hypothetical protein
MSEKPDGIKGLFARLCIYYRVGGTGCHLVLHVSRGAYEHRALHYPPIPLVHGGVPIDKLYVGIWRTGRGLG